MLTRQKDPRQLGADRKTRLQQLKDVFRPTYLSIINSCNIYLIYDVCTTGATVQARPKRLKKAGATQVNAAVFARAFNKK